MTIKQFSTIGRKLLPYFPTFVVKSELLFIPRVGDVLRGVCFENSSGTGRFFLRVLFLPLFVPRDDVSFVHGQRIRRNGSELWSADDPELIQNLHETIQCDAIPILDSVSTLAGVLDHLKEDVQSDWPRVNSHHLEELAYTLIKTGEYSGALESLRDLQQRLSKSTTPWVVEQCARARSIEEKLLQSPEEALNQLELWKTETIRKLGLEKYR